MNISSDSDNMYPIDSANTYPIEKMADDPLSISIRKRFGGIDSFARRFSPAQQRFCAQNTRVAVENDLSLFGQLVKAYTSDSMAKVIGVHVSEALMRMGEQREVNPEDVRFVSEVICDSRLSHRLRFPAIFGFFYHLKSGELDIFGQLTPRKLLEAFRKYAEKQLAVEERLIIEKEQRNEEKKRDEYRSKAITWEEYAKLRGIPEKQASDYFARVAREYRNLYPRPAVK